MNFPRRIVGDHDVDRLQVEAWQHVEPRSTNHPFGLIPVLGIGNVKTTGRKCFGCNRQTKPYDVLHMDASERARAGRKAGVISHQSTVNGKKMRGAQTLSR